MTKEIQEAVGKDLVLANHEAVCENFSYGGTYEMDIASLSKSGMLYEFEVKISRSDFLADKKKGRGRQVTKLEWYAMANVDWEARPNFFTYVCPDGLIKEHEVPGYAGLYYYSDGKLVVVKSAKKIHKNKHDKEKVLSKMMRLSIQRKYLGCAMLTYLNRQSAEKFLEYQRRQEIK